MSWIGACVSGAVPVDIFVVMIQYLSRISKIRVSGQSLKRLTILIIRNALSSARVIRLMQGKIQTTQPLNRILIC
jgi:hypothetical protein